MPKLAGNVGVFNVFKAKTGQVAPHAYGKSLKLKSGNVKILKWKDCSDFDKGSQAAAEHAGLPPQMLAHL